MNQDEVQLPPLPLAQPAAPSPEDAAALSRPPEPVAEDIAEVVPEAAPVVEAAPVAAKEARALPTSLTAARDAAAFVAQIFADIPGDAAEKLSLIHI